MNRATGSYPPLSKGYVEMSTNVSPVMWRSLVILVTHALAQRWRNMCSFKQFRLNFLQKYQVCPTVQTTGKKVLSNAVVSKNSSPNSDRETLLSLTWLRSMRVLQSPQMSFMLIEDSVTCEVCFIREKYKRSKCSVCSTLLQEPCSNRFT